MKMGGSDDVDDNEKPVERLEIANNEEEYIHAKPLCKGKLFLLLMTKNGENIKFWPQNMIRHSIN